MGGLVQGEVPDPVDPCAGIVSIKDCGATDDMLDQNGCLIVQKISCGSGSYCSGQTCEPCPAADTCSGESCCALTGPDDVCGNPTKEIGTISTVTHSDLNSNGCCESSTEESCSLNPITPRTCTPTCDGTCQGDGTCRPNCAAGESYNETAGQCCANITEEETDCRKLTPAMPGVCPHFEFISTEGFPCTTTDGLSGTCQSGVCEATSSCTDGTIVTGNNGHHYCVSKETMNWADANTWCEERGRHLASMDEACPGWDASLEEGACANINNLGGMAWSSTLDKADRARLLVGTEESTIFLSAGVNLSSRAFCY